MESGFKIYLYRQIINQKNVYLHSNKTPSLTLISTPTMEAQKNTKKYWALCFTWTVILITLFALHREFFWLALPGTLTYFAKGMDLL